MTDGQILVVAFIGAALTEIYFFLMQRVPLEVGREHQIPPDMQKLMLPSWYGLVWIAKIAKWVLVVLIWREIGWWQALVCLAVPFLLSSWLPVPYSHVANIIERRLRAEQRGSNGELAGALLGALQASREEHGF